MARLLPGMLLMVTCLLHGSDSPVGMTYEVLLKEAQFVVPQRTPSHTTWFRVGEDFVGRTPEGNLVHKGIFDRFNQVLQSGDTLLQFPIRPTTHVDLYEPGKPVLRVPIDDGRSFHTADWDGKRLFLAGADHGLLYVLSVDAAGTVLARKERPVSAQEKVGHHGTVFSLRHDDRWHVWVPHSNQIFSFTDKLELAHTISAGIPSDLTQYDRGLVSELLDLAGSLSPKELEDFCASHKGRVLSTSPIGFSYSKNGYVLCYRVSTLQGCVSGQEIDGSWRSDLFTISPADGSLQQSHSIVASFIYGLAGSDHAFVGRKAKKEKDGLLEYGIWQWKY